METLRRLKPGQAVRVEADDFDWAQAIEIVARGAEYSVSRERDDLPVLLIWKQGGPGSSSPSLDEVEEFYWSVLQTDPPCRRRLGGRKGQVLMLVREGEGAPSGSYIYHVAIRLPSEALGAFIKRVLAD